MRFATNGRFLFIIGAQKLPHLRIGMHLLLLQDHSPGPNVKSLTCCKARTAPSRCSGCQNRCLLARNALSMHSAHQLALCQNTIHDRTWAGPAWSISVCCAAKCRQSHALSMAVEGLCARVCHQLRDELLRS